MYESLLRFPGDILGEFERLQGEMEQVFGGVGRPVSIRALGRGAFPAITIGSRPDAIEVWALAPGIDPSKLEVSIDRGLLTITGERSADVPAETDKVNVYAKERFAGAFKRVISLPEDADPARHGPVPRWRAPHHCKPARRGQAAPHRGPMMLFRTEEI